MREKKDFYDFYARAGDYSDWSVFLQENRADLTLDSRLAR